ncbi:glycosyltransferase [Psychroserpens algicola]|uniref:Glycosyltransferase n=1 Tax=Psychroserpens algicola TaxID=1719034 RepID=A0ABT0H6Y5_9FLAO|nr:glycosyltransferase [Psychroserpens algicola]MCK8480123.1 glycosyltransferase [Psychroserpens algicola]
MKSNGKKICIVVTSLGKGGAERSSALLSKLLSGLGYTIHIVMIVDEINNEFQGELLNLGKIDSRFPILKKIKKLKAFKSYLKIHHFDFVIDNRSRPSLLREFIVSRWLYDPRKTIYCIHSYRLNTYFSTVKCIAKYMYKDAYKLVAVSEEIKKAIASVYDLTNVITIYNPVGDLQSQAITDEQLVSDYILFYGRINDEVKNLSLLIESYHKSELPEHNISLIILGDGKDLEAIKLKVRAKNLNKDVIFKSFIDNPYSYVKRAKFTVLTSRYEGFPMTILESLALGTPVVSVDCKSGPSEMIRDGYNGLLVENNNSEKMALAMNRFIEDNPLYLKCKSNTKPSVAKFSMEHIGQAWEQLLTKN